MIGESWGRKETGPVIKNAPEFGNGRGKRAKHIRERAERERRSGHRQPDARVSD